MQDTINIKMHKKHILSPAVAYLCVIDAKHFLNNRQSEKNASVSSVLKQ